MTATPNTTEARSATGFNAMNWAMNPAIIINPVATPQDLFSWAVTELEHLYSWLDILACSSSGIERDPCEVAGLVTERLKPLMQVFDAALKSGKV